MDLRDLVYFEKIVDVENLGRAAEALGRTKPALTKCLRRLEGTVGAPLFQRRGRRLVLTAVGEVLYHKARDLRVAREDAIAEVRDIVEGKAGHLRIGVGPTGADELLPGMLEKLLGQSPQLTTEISIGISSPHRLLLKENRLDMIITAVLPDDAERFNVHPLASDEMVVVAGKGHPLCGRPLRMEDFTAFKWILPDRSATSRQWLELAFGLRGLRKPEVQIETNALTLLSAMMQKTDLLSFMSRSNLQNGRIAESLVELPLAETTMSRQLVLLYRKSPNISPAVKRTLQILST